MTDGAAKQKQRPGAPKKAARGMVRLVKMWGKTLAGSVEAKRVHRRRSNNDRGLAPPSKAKLVRLSPELKWWACSRFLPKFWRRGRGMVSGWGGY